MLNLKEVYMKQIFAVVFLLGVFTLSFSAEEKALIQTKKFQKSFQSECIDDVDDFFEKKSAKQICSCAYDELQKDSSFWPLIHKGLERDGEVDDFDNWGGPLLKNCLPKTFTPEMEKVFVRECSDDIKKSTCKCAYEWLVSEYDVNRYLQENMESEHMFKKNIHEAILKCKD